MPSGKKLLRKAHRLLDKSSGFAAKTAQEARSSAELTKHLLRYAELKWDLHQSVKQLTQALSRKASRRGGSASAVDRAVQKGIARVEKINRDLGTCQDKIATIVRKNKWQKRALRAYGTVKRKVRAEGEKDLLLARRVLSKLLAQARITLKKKSLTPSERARILASLRRDLRRASVGIRSVQKTLLSGGAAKALKSRSGGLLRHLAGKLSEWARALDDRK